jgi:hypothetical protein
MSWSRKTLLFEIAVYIAAAADADDNYQKGVVLDLIDDAVITDAEAVRRVLGRELFRILRSRVGREPIDALGNSAAVRLGNLR